MKEFWDVFNMTSFLSTSVQRAGRRDRENVCSSFTTFFPRSNRLAGKEAWELDNMGSRLLIVRNVRKKSISRSCSVDIISLSINSEKQHNVF